MRKLFITILLGMSSLAFSQGENDNWYFGSRAAVNFAIQGSPMPLLTSDMDVYHHPVGSISDNQGNLLFYTDGRNIWNRENQIMPNGILNTNANSYGMQLCILKHPGNNNLYYIFTPVPTYINSTGVSSYSIVDMSLGSLGTNGLPLGDVLSNSNSIPLIGESESSFPARNVNIVKHSDDSSYWVIIPNKTKLYSYLVNNQGLINNPVISNMSLNIPYYTMADKPSYMKASPSLKVSNKFSNYIYISNWGMVSPGNWASTKVLSFNNTTGQITQDFILDITTNPQSSSSAEFTEDGSILYISGNSSSIVHGLDMLNISNPISSYLLPINYYSSSDGPIDMQRNKYGDIYMTLNNSNYLAKINNQNSYGAASIDVNDLYLQRNTRFNLPQLVQSKKIMGDCQPYLIFTGNEVNDTYIYRAENTINTHTDYLINSNQNIEMRAGSSITLNPNTTIRGNYLAKIEDCKSNMSNSMNSRNVNSIFDKPIRLSLDLRTKGSSEFSDLKISPNPTSDVLNIKTDSKINSVSVVDMTGKKVNVKLEGTQVDVKALPAGNYLINVETKDGISTEKFIKK